MTYQELVDNINFQVEKAEPQSEENLTILEMHYANLFSIHCGSIPNFKLTNTKGAIQLVKEKDLM